MFKNYLKIAVRNIRRRPAYASINIAGFAIGMACCMLIFLFVRHEHTFDEGHEKGDRIYRLNKRVTQIDGPEEHHAITAGLMGPAIAERYPEVEESVRLLSWFDDVLFRRGDETYKLSDVVFADENIFDVFDFQLIRGNTADALVAPMSVVLSESVASRMFAGEDPVGQTVIGLNDLPYTVTGIIEDVPEQSHIRYNVLVSWSSTKAGDGTLNLSWLNRWLTQVNYTYLLLQEGADADALTAKLPPLLEQNLPEKAGQYHLYLQPFNEIYLNSADILFSRNLRLGNGTYVNIFIVIGVLIMLIACFNFTNLATAQSGRRAREIGVRKVLGARRKQIGGQFFYESLLLIVFSLLAAFMVVSTVLPAFNAFIGRDLALFSEGGLSFLWAMVGLATFTVALAAGYPSVFLSRFKPIKIINQRARQAAGGHAMRKVLVTTQFLFSIVLIVSTVVVARQLSFIEEKDPGFDREHVLVIDTGDTNVSRQFDAFKNELLAHPNIIAAAGSNSVPGTRAQMMSFTLRAEGRSEDENIGTYVWRLDDYDLLDTYQMRMAAGRFFSEAFPTDTSEGIVINEALAHRLGWDEPVGKQLDIPGEIEGSRVLGVLQDFHFESLHHPIEPLAFYFAPRYGNLSVRIAGGDLSEVLAFIGATWQQFEPAYPFEYTFLDESAAGYYETEKRLMRILMLFASLAVLIACLGLLGLSAFAVQQRTKEIGIRKVIGARVSSLVMLLSKDFLRLVGIAFLIAIPVAYLASDYWLEGFTYRVSISWWIFLLSGVVALSIAFLTISAHCVRAALANPIQALRYE